MRSSQRGDVAWTCGADLVVVARLRAAPVDRLRGSGGASSTASTVTSVSDLDVLKDAERVGDHDRHRVVRGDQVGDDRLLVDAHEPHRQAGLVFVRYPGLVQADHALVLLAGPD